MSNIFNKSGQCSDLTLLGWARSLRDSDKIPAAQRLDDTDISAIAEFSGWANTNSDVYLSQAEYTVAIASWRDRFTSEAVTAIDAALAVCGGRITIGK